MSKKTDNISSRLSALREFSIILSGYACFEALYAAIRFDLFSTLSRSPGLSQAAIQKKLGLKAQPARVLLMSCVALKLIHRQDGRFWNLPISEVYLVKKSPKNLISVIQAHHEILYRPLFHLHDSLRNNRNDGLKIFPGRGGTIYSRLGSYPRLEGIFHAWMQNIGAEIDVETHCFPLVAKQFRRMSHVVDMGGGDGANAEILLRMFPHLQVSVFDHPSVCALAKKRRRGSAFKNRLKFIPGDFLNDPVPKTSDGIFFSHIFNIYSPERNISFLKKCYRALPKGGSVIIFNSVVLEDDAPSVSAAHLSMYFTTLATGEGMVYSVSDYDGWFKKAGFRKLEKITMPNYQKAFFIGTK